MYTTVLRTHLLPLSSDPSRSAEEKENKARRGGTCGFSKADLVTRCCEMWSRQTAKTLTALLFHPSKNNTIDYLKSISSIKDDWWHFPAAAHCLCFPSSHLVAGRAEALIRMRESLPPTLQCAWPHYCHLGRPNQLIMQVCLHLLFLLTGGAKQTQHSDSLYHVRIEKHNANQFK